MFHVKQFEKIFRESKQDIDKYIKILLEWQKHVNLISKNTITDIQKRHVLDSAQLWKYIPDSSKTLTDVGSGGGFPGVILGILNKTAGFPLKITLIESDSKKAIFLAEVNRQLKLNLTILTERVEKVCYLNMLIKQKEKGSLFAHLVKLVKEAQASGLVVAGDPSQLVESVFLLLKGLYLTFLLEKYPDIRVPSVETVMQLLRKPTNFSRQIL